MKDICIDSLGNERCWNCGNKSFTPVESFKSKLMHESESLLNRPNLVCTRCGAHSKVGNAKIYSGPLSEVYAEEWEKEQLEDRTTEAQRVVGGIEGDGDSREARAQDAAFQLKLDLTQYAPPN